MSAGLLEKGIGKRRPYSGTSEAPTDLSAEIEDITIGQMAIEDESGRRQVPAANVKVRIFDGDAEWTQVFQFPIFGIIEWDTFLAKLQERIKKEYRIDRGISQLVKRKGQRFKVFKQKGR